MARNPVKTALIAGSIALGLGGAWAGLEGTVLRTSWTNHVSGRIPAGHYDLAEDLRWLGPLSKPITVLTISKPDGSSITYRSIEHEYSIFDNVDDAPIADYVWRTMPDGTQLRAPATRADTYFLRRDIREIVRSIKRTRPGMIVEASDDIRL